MQLFRTEQQFDNATKDIAVLDDAGVPYSLLTADQLATVEPALAKVAHKLTGGYVCLMMKPVTVSYLRNDWPKWLNRLG